jgi:hypothetical protein
MYMSERPPSTLSTSVAIWQASGSAAGMFMIKHSQNAFQEGKNVSVGYI